MRFGMLVAILAAAQIEPRKDAEDTVEPLSVSAVSCV